MRDIVIHACIKASISSQYQNLGNLPTPFSFKSLAFVADSKYINSGRLTNTNESNLFTTDSITRKMWHKVNFKDGKKYFELRCFLLLDIR